MQRNILGEVSVNEMKGLFNDLNEKLSDVKSGHYWKSQIKKLLRKEPTHTFSEDWQKKLNNPETWEKAESYFKETGRLWFNELEWPFEICVLKIGKYDKEGLKHSLSRTKNMGVEQFIKDIDLMTLEEKEKKIALIRIPARIIGFEKDYFFHAINRINHSYNLDVCPTETAFYLAILADKYSDKEATVVSRKGTPAFKGENVYTFFCPRFAPNGKEIYMGCLSNSEIWSKTLLSPKLRFIFQYVPKKFD